MLKNIYTFEERCYSSHLILQKYPDYIPIYLESITSELLLKKNKYLCPCSFTFSQFICNIRASLTLQSNKALFIFINSTMPYGNQLMYDIYEKDKDMDGFLYMVISYEHTFG